jgi:hypothetical protein
VELNVKEKIKVTIMNKFIRIGLIGTAILFFNCVNNEERITSLKIDKVTEIKAECKI